MLGAKSHRISKMRKEAMSGTWRWPKRKSWLATSSGRRITTSTPNIISDQCRRTQKRREIYHTNHKLVISQFKSFSLNFILPVLSSSKSISVKASRSVPIDEFLKLEIRDVIWSN
jgi:hypothetical protein